MVPPGAARCVPARRPDAASASVCEDAPAAVYIGLTPPAEVPAKILRRGSSSTIPQSLKLNITLRVDLTLVDLKQVTQSDQQT